jgi:hypothetical protein
LRDEILAEGGCQRFRRYAVVICIAFSELLREGSTLLGGLGAMRVTTLLLKLWHIVLLILSCATIYYMLSFFDLWISDFGFVHLAMIGAIMAVGAATVVRKETAIRVWLLGLASLVHGANFVIAFW